MIMRERCHRPFAATTGLDHTPGMWQPLRRTTKTVNPSPPSWCVLKVPRSKPFLIYTATYQPMYASTSRAVPTVAASGMGLVRLRRTREFR